MARAIVGAADAIAQKDESDRKMRQAVLDALKEEFPWGCRVMSEDMTATVVGWYADRLVVLDGDNGLGSIQVTQHDGRLSVAKLDDGE